MEDDSQDKARILAALQQVIDPEVGESIVDLGLVERIEVLPWQVHVTLVPTSAACPMADVLVEEASDAIQELFPATEVCVEIDWGAQWTPQRMSEPLRRSFGW